jgi:lysine 6-dehydrogenase
MSTVAVLGSGIVGRAAAWDLSRRGHEVIVADWLEAAAAEAAAIAGATPRVVDASDDGAVRALLDEMDLVVSGVPYAYGVAIATAAADTSTHYLDFGGNPTIVRRQLELDAGATAAGITLVPDCGLAPGMANVLATGVVERLGDGPIDELRLRVGALPADPTGVLGYQLAFNPAGLINEYAEPCEVLRDGAYAEVEPLTELEEVPWEPFGTLEAFHTAGGSSSLPRLYEGRIAELDYKTLRYPGHALPFRAMLEVGLFDEDPQRGSGMAPRSVLLEALDEHLPTGGDDLVLVRVWGRAGDDVVGYEIVDRNDERFSALARTTAFPTTALAQLILEGRCEPGARTMDEAMDASDLVNELGPVGIDVNDVADPVAILTGGTGGLGRQVARLLADRGYRIALTYLVPDEANEVEEFLGLPEDRLLMRRVDCSDGAAVEAFVTETVARFGGLNVLTCLVGGWAGGRDVEETDDVRFDRMIDLNLRPSFNAARAAIPHLKAAEWGRIITIGSRSALDAPSGQAMYNAAKAAVIALGRTIADELSGTAVTSNVVLPSLIDTPAFREVVPFANYVDWPTPQEISEVIGFLASKESSVITGAMIPVYGNA